MSSNHSTYIQLGFVTNVHPKLASFLTHKDLVGGVGVNTTIYRHIDMLESTFGAETTISCRHVTRGRIIRELLI